MLQLYCQNYNFIGAYLNITWDHMKYHFNYHLVNQLFCVYLQFFTLCVTHSLVQRDKVTELHVARSSLFSLISLLTIIQDEHNSDSNSADFQIKQMKQSGVVNQ